jgi:predicted nucleotidyltransferase
MGVVFTPQQFAEGRIPESFDYGIANRLVRTGLARLADSGVVLGAVFSGSVGARTARPGSDLDVVVVRRSFEDGHALENLRATVEEATNVPIEFIPVVAPLALRGVHRIDYFFAEYLRGLSDVVGNHPAAYFSPLPSWSDPRAERVRENREKTMRLDKRLINAPRYDAERCNTLQQILSWPVVAALDCIRVEDGKNPVDGLGQLPSKRAIQSMFEERYGAAPVLGSAIDLMDEYRTLLETSRDVENYAAMLGRIESLADSVVPFLLECADRMETS